jgi:hypothetical protein
VPDVHSPPSTPCGTSQETKYYVQQGIQVRRHLIDIFAMTMRDKNIKTQDNKNPLNPFKGWAVFRFIVF